MNILSMQSGGGMPPFTYYQPVAVNNQQPQQVASSSSARSSADATERGKITDKDLMDMLGKIDGLPNDMNKVYDMMSTFYREQELGISTSSLSTTYLRALQYLKTAKFNKEQFDNAYKTVSKNKGLNEIAINETGHIIARDENNNIKYLTAEDYLNNRDKYLAYTNQDLLQIRAEDPDYAYKNGLFNAVNNGIGLEVVDKLVQQYMIKLGENSMTNEGYVQTKDGKIIQGLEYIQSAAKQAAESGQQFNASGVSIDGLYKTKLLTKEQAAQAQNALQYIYSMLPDNAKTLLKVKTGSDKNALNMLAGFVSGQVDSTYEFNVDMVEDAFGLKPGSATKDQSEKTHTDLFQNIIRGEGGTTTKYNLMDKDGNVLSINGTAYPSLSRNPSNPVDPEGSLKTLLAKDGLNGITRGGNYAITFGDKVLSDADMQDIAYMNDTQATRVILPITQDIKTGKIIPDLNFIAENKDIIDLINSKQSMQDPDVIKKLQEKGIVNPLTGLPDMTKFQSYLCINGLGTSRNLSTSDYTEEITGKDLDKYINVFERSVYLDKQHGDQGSAYKFNFDTQDWYDITSWFGDYDHLYKGTIFIPLTENTLQGGIAAGTNFQTTTADNMEETYQRGNLMKTAKPTSSNLLGI